MLLAPGEALARLHVVFPNLMQDAARYTAAVKAAAEKGILCGPAAGTVFGALPEVANGRSLALVLQFDGLSVAKNALGAAASSSKKFYIPVHEAYQRSLFASKEDVSAANSRGGQEDR